MPKEKKATNAAEEKVVRNEIDYDNTVKDYEEKKKDVEMAIDMIETPFWQRGFKSRREVKDKSYKKFIESAEVTDVDNYERIEYNKVLNKAKLDFTKAGNDFDIYVADVESCVDILHVFCTDENLPLFDDLVMMEATFSRKTGKITMKKVKR